MTTYSTSKTVEVIRDIDRDSSALWLMLEDDYIRELSNEQITKLFINILHLDSNRIVRFSMSDINNYLELNKHEGANTNVSYYYHMLTLTRSKSLTHFLFI